MSRISRYQDSISRFIKNKSCINDESVDINIKNNIFELTNDCEYLVPILLLTVLNNQIKKNKATAHGYYMSCSIELLAIIIRINENNHPLLSDNLIYKSVEIINNCMTQNIEHIQTKFACNKVINIYTTLIRILNSKIYDIIKTHNFTFDDKIRKTDIIKYKLLDNNEIIKKLQNVNRVEKSNMIKYINDKYGSLCSLSINSGWIMGGSNIKVLKKIDEIGNSMGIVIKIATDFKNLNKDLLIMTDYSKNYIINYGIQNAFELFIDNKINVVEGFIKLDSYTNTIKEIIDIYESYVDNFIDNVEPDLKSNYTIKNNSKIDDVTFSD